MSIRTCAHHELVLERLETRSRMLEEFPSSTGPLLMMMMMMMMMTLGNSSLTSPHPPMMSELEEPSLE